MTSSSPFARPDRNTVLIAALGLVLIAGGLVAALMLLSPAVPEALALDPSTVVAPYGQDELPSGAIHEVSLVAAAGTMRLDGVDVDNVWSFNGSVPGPEIRIQLGDTVKITVQNDLDVATAVHWHGIRVPNGMDGVPGITQDPIAPGSSFVYEFTPPDVGTYWYHSHKRGNEQLERGLYGAFVVEDAEPAAYSQDVTLLVDDWLLDQVGQLDTDFDSSEDLHHNGRWGNALSVNAEILPTITAAPGERLRLRLVNASNGRIYQLRFGELDAVAIAMDGFYVDRPLPVDGLEIAPGNRVDIDVTIPVDAKGSFVIADSLLSFSPVPLMTLEVSGDPVDPPSFAPPTAPVPDWSDAIEWEPNGTFELSLIGDEDIAEDQPTGLAGDFGGVFGWAINGRVWPDHRTHVASLGQAEKLRFVNDSGAFHPMHLHGQFFQVVARNGVPVCEGHFRDTVLLNSTDTVDIVVVPTDVGVWALHCHIQLHAEYGMFTMYEVR